MAKKTVDIMLDLETLGNKNSPVITQISAVACNLETGKLLGDEFDEFVNPMSCVKAGLDVDGGTVSWWLTQDRDAINKVLVKSISSGKDLDKVQKLFNDWIEMIEKKYDCKVLLWGNGCLADNKWIESSYEATGVKMPWRYYQHQDVRTLVALGKRVYGIDPKKTIPFTGTKHNAIDDCKHQIKYCSTIYKEAKKGANALKRKKKS